jgi:hypothetical protein
MIGSALVLVAKGLGIMLFSAVSIVLVWAVCGVLFCAVACGLSWGGARPARSCTAGGCLIARRSRSLATHHRSSSGTSRRRQSFSLSTCPSTYILHPRHRFVAPSPADLRHCGVACRTVT